MGEVIFWLVILLIVGSTAFWLYKSFVIVAAPDVVVVEFLGRPREENAVVTEAGPHFFPWPFQKAFKAPGKFITVNVEQQSANTSDGFKVKEDGNFGWRLLTLSDMEGNNGQIQSQPMVDEEAAKQFIYQFDGSISTVNHYLTLLYKNTADELIKRFTANQLTSQHHRIHRMVQNAMNNELWNARGVRICITYVSFEDLTPIQYLEQQTALREAETKKQIVMAEQEGLAQAYLKTQAQIQDADARKMILAKQTIMPEGAQVSYNLFGAGIMDAVRSMFSFGSGPSVPSDDTGGDIKQTVQDAVENSLRASQVRKAKQRTRSGFKTTKYKRF